MTRKQYLQAAIDLALENTREGKAQPFGAVIVKDGQVISTGVNEIFSTNDPTAHAEIQAIRKACEKIGSYLLTDCELYASSQPCPLCMEAISWAEIKKVYYAASFEEAAEAGFNPRADHESMVERVDMEGAQKEPLSLWTKLKG
ncbi:nucleoside deaminase [Metabacillus fastidiosus]|uniref:nucleoside deaminase n=1 Tax=Metabacillus fastidiosus TaxID=1458 RepID=UPI003D29EC79